MLPILLLAVVGTVTSTLIVASGLYYGSYFYRNLHANYENQNNRYLSNAFDDNFLQIPLSMMECLAYGALISSTDPVSTLSIFSEVKVDPSLFYLVFGESVLNDAIAITVFKVASSYVGMVVSGVYE